MPNFKYDGANGVVQSTGTGDFQVSGVGISQDVETITATGTHRAGHTSNAAQPCKARARTAAG